MFSGLTKNYQLLSAMYAHNNQLRNYLLRLKYGMSVHVGNRGLVLLYAIAIACLVLDIMTLPFMLWANTIPYNPATYGDVEVALVVRNILIFSPYLVITILSLVQAPLLFAVAFRPASVKPVRWLFYSFIISVVTFPSGVLYSNYMVPGYDNYALIITLIAIGGQNFVLVPLFLFLQRAKLSYSAIWLKKVVRASTLILILLPILLIAFAIIFNTLTNLESFNVNGIVVIQDPSASMLLGLSLVASSPLAYSVIAFSTLLLVWSKRTKQDWMLWLALVAIFVIVTVLASYLLMFNLI